MTRNEDERDAVHNLPIAMYAPAAMPMRMIAVTLLLALVVPRATAALNTPGGPERVATSPLGAAGTIGAGAGFWVCTRETEILSAVAVTGAAGWGAAPETLNDSFPVAVTDGAVAGVAFLAGA